MTRSIALSFALVTLVFSFLAFWKISDQGILYHDVGMNLLETKFIDEGFRLALSGLPDISRPQFWEEIKTKTEGVPLHHGKPGFNLILWLAGKILGFTDALSAKVTAVSGVLVLFLSFFTARRFGGSSLSALYGSAILSSSTFFLVYSRAGIADQAANVFFLGGILLYLGGSKKNFPLAAGICLGFGFTCNQLRSGYLPALVAALDGLKEIFKSGETGKRFHSTFFLILGILLPIAVFQAPYGIARNLWGPLPFRDYWAQLFERSRQMSDMLWFEQPLELAQSYLKVEGPVFCLFIAAGWIFLAVRLLIRRQFSDLFLFALSLIPFLYFSAMSYGPETLPRTVSAALPFAAIAAGQFLGWLQEYFEQRSSGLHAVRPFLTLFLTLLLMGPKFPYNMRFGITKSGYPEASRFLASTGEKKFFLLAQEPIWRFYLGRVAHEPYDRPPTLETLIEEAKAHNIRYLIVDNSTIYSKYGMEYTAALPVKYNAVAKFPHPRGASLPYLLDEFSLAPSLQISQDPLSREIFIFDISTFAGEVPPQAAA